MRLAPWLVLVAACHFGTPGDDAPDAPPPIDAEPPIDSLPEVSVFDPAVTTVAIEIDYETGAEPFAGPIAAFGDTFDITVANLDRLFAGKKQLAIPRTLAAMTDIGAVGDEELTVADLLALAALHRASRDTASVKTYYVLVVSGHYADATGPNPNIVGVSIGTTGVIALFKDVIRASSVLPNVQSFVEQSTLVHELGHAIGLVNSGVPPTSAHQDAAHGAHCSNPSCVMNWQNETASAVAAFALQYVLVNNAILFRAECLADVDALTGGP